MSDLPVQMSASHSDEEKALRPKTGHSNPLVEPTLFGIVERVFGRKNPADEDLSKKISSAELAAIDPPVPAGDQLAIFRRLTGIDSGVAHRRNKPLNLYRPAPNEGIYQHVIDEEKAARKKYLIFSRLINGCLGLQIIVAAALTALGAGNGPHAVVTIFGAINTVIAGFLTYLKGSGLPNQPKSFQNEWSKLREFIEQRERDFGRQDCKLLVDEQVTIVEEMYKEIRAAIEANTSDGFMSIVKARDKTRLGSSSTVEQANGDHTKIEGR
jgi:hypothetical protein